MPTSLAVVIVTFNSGDVLTDCLRSLRAQAFSGRLAIHVVDNASTDGTAGTIAREFPDVQLTVSPTNVGFSAGNNLALRPILEQPEPPDAILLLNPDTVVPPGGLAGLMAALTERPGAGIVGPRTATADGQMDPACRRSFPTPLVSFYRFSGLARLFPRSRRFGRYNLTFLDPNRAAEVDAVSGAAMLARTAAVRQIGLLDEAFFMYGEDLDWCLRMKSAGWQVWFDPRVTILHLRGVSTARRPGPARKAFYDAMRIFHRKHYADRTPRLLNRLIEFGISIIERRSS